MAHTDIELNKFYLQKGLDYQPRTKHFENNKAKFTNHLILANSPYLLQHAHNPVNWHQFDDEAFNLAKIQNKMIFLSVGYATCHWCHVMEEESFEDLEVAKVLNENFIAIKVDREVLPDVDSHFMNIAQLLNGSGGWPLNIVLTPDGDGFYAGTYFPTKNLINILSNLQNLWETDKKRIIVQAQEIKTALKDEVNNVVKIPKDLQQLAVAQQLLSFDEFYGGFYQSPKFPHEPLLLGLINQQMRNPSADKLEAITTTLNVMASGGIYDVVGGGFHRYSVDEKWLVPHFEKMLYNQAQLAQTYIKAYQLTGKFLYKRIAEQTLDYTIREMQNGGFYSATDADSDGEEGLFFIWKIEELKDILAKDFDTFAKYFDLSEATEFEEHNIIRYQDISSITESEFTIIDKMLNKLYQVRNTRNKPLLDNKILLSWNALLLKSLITASEINTKYLAKSIDLADYLLDNFYKEHNLQRVSIDGKVSNSAIFEDYIYLADALIILYDKTGQDKYLKVTQDIVNTAIDKFWDTTNFGFNISNNKRIKNNIKEIYDGAIASSNGVAYGVLTKLSNRATNQKYKILAKQLVASFSIKITKNPSAYPTLVKNYNDDKQGELSNIIYAYSGKVKITVLNKQIIIEIAKGWHINANKTIQPELIATTVTSNNFGDIIYPTGEIKYLGFSKEKLAIYSDRVVIDFSTKNQNFTIGTIEIQACSDKVCLAPVKLPFRKL